MNVIERLSFQTPKYKIHYRHRNSQSFHGLPGQGGNWKAHWKSSGIHRSDGYGESIRKLDEQRADEIRRQNWKHEQIHKLQKERAISARVKSRPGDNGEVIQKIGSISA